MYEELIEFLLGRKEELTDDDLDKFVDLLANALEITEEYDIHKKQTLIANMVNCTNVVDKTERAEIASAIDKILQFEVSEDDTGDIFESEDESAAVPLRSRKFKRGHVTPSSVAGDKKRTSKRKQITEALEENKQAKPEMQDEEAVLTTSLVSDVNDGGHPSTVEPLLEMEQEDLLRSVCNDICTPDKRQKLSSGKTVKFSEVFSTNVSGDKSRTNNFDEDKIESGDFKFEIGELEENHNEGPEYVFKIDDSME